MLNSYKNFSITLDLNVCTFTQKPLKDAYLVNNFIKTLSNTEYINSDIFNKLLQSFDLSFK